MEPTLKSTPDFYIYDVVPFDNGWRICKQGQSQIIATTETVNSAIGIIMGFISGSGYLCRIRVYRRGGDVESQFCSFSPAPRSDSHARAGSEVGQSLSF